MTINSDWERSGPSWTMSSLRQPFVSGVVDRSRSVMRVLYVFSCNSHHTRLIDWIQVWRIWRPQLRNILVSLFFRTHCRYIYLVDDCHAISAIAGKRHLRSADTGTSFVPRTTTTLGMRSFAVAGPRIWNWNSLPAALRTATLSPLTFARHLKSHLFDWLTAPLRTI